MVEADSPVGHRNRGIWARLQLDPAESRHTNKGRNEDVEIKQNIRRIPFLVRFRSGLFDHQPGDSDVNPDPDRHDDQHLNAHTRSDKYTGADQDADL